ncbi:hypothetical protein [Streptomyces klenkii]|uniref:hypothetical protein n=1 Tax=Streptomyces klenkii TaxID=1420899 RepID=UPI0034214912
MRTVEHDGDLRVRDERLPESWATDQETLERLWDALHRLKLPDPPAVTSPEARHVPLPLMAPVPAVQPVRPRRHARARHRRRRDPVPVLLRRKRTAVLLVVPAACAVPLIPPLMR